VGYITFIVEHEMKLCPVACTINLNICVTLFRNRRNCFLSSFLMWYSSRPILSTHCFSLVTYDLINADIRSKFDPRQRQRIFLLTSEAHLSLPGRDVDHSPPSSAEMKNG
jgi:hypothetical protein